MALLLSFPLRLTAAGTFAVREDISDEYFGEELAQLVQTRPGERELVPSYGLNDPAYSEVDAGMLTAQVRVFGPPVVIVDVVSQIVRDGAADVTVSFTAQPDLEADDGDDTVSAAGFYRETDEEFE